MAAAVLVGLAASPAPSPAQATALFDHRAYLGSISAWRNFDVAPGGRSFIFPKPIRRTETVEPIVVLNWVEEVKRLMLAAGIK